MGRKRSYIPLNIFIGSRHVGIFSRKSSGAHHLSYSDAWQSWEHHFPISLSLPVRTDSYSGERVINVFENLLPDREDIRRHVAERVGASGTDTYSLLSTIGRDCIGALQFIPDGIEQNPTDTIEGTKLSETDIEDRLNNLARAPLGMGEDDAFRISIAGVQEKTAFLFHDGEWLEPHGTTPTTHIIKPPIGELDGGFDLSDSVENEHFCLKLLKAFDLPIANTEIHQFGEKKALVIERFDRRWAKDGRLIRLPQEDMCQALSVPSTQKYQDRGGPGVRNISDLLTGSDRPEFDRLNFMKANILFWLMGAVDGHAKNFSIFLKPGGTFEMTPLYDVLTVQPSFDKHHFERKQYRISMHVGERRRYRVFDVRGKDFIFTGLKAGYSKTQMEELIHSILTYWESAFETTAKLLEGQVPSVMIDSVREGFRSRLSQLQE